MKNRRNSSVYTKDKTQAKIIAAYIARDFFEDFENMPLLDIVKENNIFLSFPSLKALQEGKEKFSFFIVNKKTNKKYFTELKFTDTKVSDEREYLRRQIEKALRTKYSGSDPEFDELNVNIINIRPNTNFVPEGVLQQLSFERTRGEKVDEPIKASFVDLNQTPPMDRNNVFDLFKELSNSDNLDFIIDYC